MKIQTPTEFLTFNSGVCDIYSVKGNMLDKIKITALHFGDRTIGMRRFYVARSASSEISRLVHVPQQRTITVKDRAMIDGAEYKIDAVQHLNDTNPPVSVLTLIYIGGGI